MLAQIVDRWIYKDVPHEVGEIVLMPDELYTHVLDAAAVKPAGEKPAKVFNALKMGVPISSDLKVEIEFTEDEQHWYFRIDGVQYSMHKTAHTV